MKKINKFFLLLAVGAMACTACSKKDEEVDPNAPVYSETIEVTTDRYTLQTVLGGYNLLEITDLKINGRLSRADCQFLKTELPNVVCLRLMDLNERSLPAGAFAGSMSLNYVYCNKVLVNLGSHVCSTCRWLRNAFFPGATVLTDWAFANCPRLEWVVLGPIEKLQGASGEPLPTQLFRNTDTSKIRLTFTAMPTAGDLDLENRTWAGYKFKLIDFGSGLLPEEE